MSRLIGLVLAGGMVLGMASSSNAQMSISVGAPYSGGGVYVGAPAYGYGYGYNSAYSGYANPAAPLVTGYATPAYGYPAYRYPAYRVYRPAYGYGYGYRRGFGPFRRW